MTDQSNPLVSVVIVCMNNLKNLYPCLESIKACTNVSCEVLVVAYLFSCENLEQSKCDFPWVKFIESNELRGFAENNNLALRQAKGKYCFVINDDTILKPNCIDRLVEAFQKLPENVAIVSPNVYDAEGKLAVSGKPPYAWYHPILHFLRIEKKNKKKQWVKGEKLFRTYNILGAAFMIKTYIFRSVGWFDEYYYFAPEDIALSTLLNKQGYECWVEPKAQIVHLEGLTSGHTLSRLRTATEPAAKKGQIHLFSEGKWHIYFVLALAWSMIQALKATGHFAKAKLNSSPNKYEVLYLSELNSIYAFFTRKTPKEIFIKFYNKLQHNNLCD